MFPHLQGGTAGPVPVGAVHDSVASIASSPAYNRSISESLWNAFWRWLNDSIDKVIDQFRGSGTGRWITIVLLVLLVVLILLRAYLAAKAARENAAQEVSNGRGGTITHPWQVAQQLAAAGNFTEAAHALLAALLAAFAARGEVRLHASKTAGDYARELRRRGSPAQRRFDAFRNRYDVAVYLRGEVSGAEYAGLLEDARPLIEGANAA